ncbi:sulfite exporter TauE/SafE family protein, partial [Aminobacter aminovorans]
KKSGQHNWIHRLPFKMRFRTSKLFVSVIPVLGIGAGIGFLSAIMGVGGGFIMVPALIYLLKVPTNVVVGTSLFQIVVVSAFTTLVHSSTNQTVDIILALVLMVGGVAGAQYGAKAGQKLRGEQLRALLALLVLAVALRLGFDLFVKPQNLYSLTGVSGLL